jgi:hypothetical protein
MTVTAYIWSYRVKPEWRTRFLDAYGPNGEWAAFFARSPDFIRTVLFADEDDADAFMTIDYFRGSDARSRLVDQFAADYEAVDARWREATEDETFIGAFAVVSKE